MFSGIIEEVGKITAISDSAEGRRMRFKGSTVLQGTRVGDSISVSGACLTAVEISGGEFAADASFETLDKTRLGKLVVGARVNLERALKLDDRLGGHLVSGHVDCLATVKAITKSGFARIIQFEAPARLAPYFIEKGSVALDGVSLTIAGLGPEDSEKVCFTVAVIPHTLKQTTLEELEVGSLVNLETDLIGKYVARWLGNPALQKINKEGLTISFLEKHGYT